ncbi:MAG: dihydroorotase [Peptococcaceae bacterium]|nr:dihydroorotase [Peptococcaceae bacterium]
MVNEVKVLTGATLADPVAGIFQPFDIKIRGERIEGIYPPGSLGRAAADQRLSLEGCILAPGLTDLHVHLRAPGGEANETVASGLMAAAAGGFTTVCAMPNSGQVADKPEVLSYLRERAAASGLARLLPIAAVTKGLAGKELTDMAALKDAGAAAFSDDGMPIWDSGIMEAALYRAKALGLPVIDHCEDPGLKRDGLIHGGVISREMDLPGISAVSEAVPIARNILLAQKTGGRAHIAHLSTAEGVALLRFAQREGIAVTAEAMPHHLRLTDEVLRGGNTMGKVSPPLRDESHRQAVATAVKSGLITCIATDHAPWSADAKARPFAQAPNGISGLETALAVVWDTLVLREKMPILDLLARFILGPAAVLGRPPATIAPGAVADLVAIDPGKVKKVDPNAFYSLGKNTPFAGLTLRGWPVLTLYRGRITMREGQVYA